MNDTALARFFGVVARPLTWLGILFHVLAFPFGLFYLVFLATGISVGVGLVVVWVGIPILLVVAGAWWLFGAFERIQAHYLLGADVEQAPREWEKADGVWGKLRAHFGSSATWKDLLYLLTKIVFGTVSFTLLVVTGSIVGWFFAMPFFVIFDVPIVNGTWVPPLWFGVLAVPLGILAFFVSLHVLNGWGWVCARWAEFMFRGAGAPRPTQTMPLSAGAPASATPPPVTPPPPAQTEQPRAPQAPTIPSPPQTAQPGDPASAQDETSRS